jgi:hypothetical protein
MNIIDTQTAFFYNSLPCLNHDSNENDEWTDLI